MHSADYARKRRNAANLSGFTGSHRNVVWSVQVNGILNNLRLKSSLIDCTSINVNDVLKNIALLFGSQLYPLFGEWGSRSLNMANREVFVTHVFQLALALISIYCLTSGFEPRARVEFKWWSTRLLHISTFKRLVQCLCVCQCSVFTCTFP